MADLHSPRVPLTVSLPADVVEELGEVARYKQVSLDEVVLEACLAYTEPYLWEKEYAQRRASEPDVDFGIDGRPLPPPAEGRG